MVELVSESSKFLFLNPIQEVMSFGGVPARCVLVGLRVRQSHNENDSGRLSAAMMSRRFYKVMLGRGSSAAAEARADGFLGANYDVEVDLSSQLPD